MAANTYTANKMEKLIYPLRLNRGIAFGAIILIALFAFEIFNYGTTEFALNDLLGELKFLGLRWATILSIAFCGIDFAGIAHLFAPDRATRQHDEVWYLFGAWLLAATMNAMLTWWGVSLAILNHQSLGNPVIGRDLLLQAVPIFVAVMVWLIRILIIGTFSVAGEHLFQLNDDRNKMANHSTARSTASPPERSLADTTHIINNASTRPQNITNLPRAAAPASTNFRPAPKPTIPRSRTSLSEPS